MSQRHSVVTAAEWPSLERPQAINDDGQQYFLGEAIHARFFNGPVLEENHGSVNMIQLLKAGVTRCIEACYLIGVAGPASARLIQHCDG